MNKQTDTPAQIIIKRIFYLMLCCQVCRIDQFMHFYKRSTKRNCAETQQTAFDKAKSLLQSSVVLAHFTLTLPRN